MTSEYLTKVLILLVFAWSIYFNSTLCFFCHQQNIASYIVAIITDREGIMLPIFEVFAIGSSGQTCSNIPSTRTSSIAIGILCGVAVVYLLVRRCRTFDSDSDSEADDEDDGGDANNTESIPLPEHFQCFVVAVVNTVAECEATVDILTK